MQAQMMIEDRYFFDPVTGTYTVDRYLDDLEKRFGGIDSVLIWPSYPNVGIDNRNQFESAPRDAGRRAGGASDGRAVSQTRRACVVPV